MTGAELLRGKPSASTIVADRRDPAYDGKTHLAAGEIDPAKTYRVAMGYFGMPSYGAEPGRMPKLFPFATPQDFLAVEVQSHAAEEVPATAPSGRRGHGPVHPAAQAGLAAAGLFRLDRVHHQSPGQRVRGVRLAAPGHRGAVEGRCRPAQRPLHSEPGPARGRRAGGGPAARQFQALPGPRQEGPGASGTSEASRLRKFGPDKSRRPSALPSWTKSCPSR